jgi:hypothetical protein
VALKWVPRETDADKARQLRAEYQQQIHELLAPDVFPIEVAHALARSERRGIITPAEARDRCSWQTSWPDSRTSSF